MRYSVCNGFIGNLIVTNVYRSFSLENRLKKLKSDSDVLGQLTARREACLQQLLNGDINLEENLTLEAPLSNSALLRTILPQKQALTQGEIVQFAKYDQLVDSYVDKEIETERKEDL